MIKFTQFMRPNGRKQEITISRPKEIENKANILIGAGCRFEIEILRTGLVSLEIMAKDSWDVSGTLANELVPNGPEVLKAVDNLVERAMEKWNLQQNETNC